MSLFTKQSMAEGLELAAKMKCGHVPIMELRHDELLVFAACAERERREALAELEVIRQSRPYITVALAANEERA